VSALTDVVTGRSAEELREFFSTVSAVEAVDLLAGAARAELVAIAKDDRAWTACVDTLIHRFGEFALPEQLAKVNGVVAMHIVEGKVRREHALAFDGVGVAVIEVGSRKPDLQFEIGAVDFLHLIAGVANAAYLVLGGQLRLEGDALLALAIGGVFQVPGQPGVAVDPTQIDPEEIARVLNGVKHEYLERVMNSALREVVMEQIRMRIPERLDVSKAGDQRLAVGFNLDGGRDRFAIVVENGGASVDLGDTKRDATLVMSGANFLKLVTGHLSPVTGVIRRQMSVKGDLQAALALHRIMIIPDPKAKPVS
jgi:putative sterol carrier protein